MTQRPNNNNSYYYILYFAVPSENIYIRGHQSIYLPNYFIALKFIHLRQYYKWEAKENLRILSLNSYFKIKLQVWGGRREEGSGWGTRVYLWRIHVDIWQNQYNIVKLKNKIKLHIFQICNHSFKKHYVSYSTNYRNTKKKKVQ